MNSYMNFCLMESWTELLVILSYIHWTYMTLLEQCCFCLPVVFIIRPGCCSKTLMVDIAAAYKRHTDGMLKFLNT